MTCGRSLLLMTVLALLPLKPSWAQMKQGALVVGSPASTVRLGTTAGPFTVRRQQLDGPAIAAGAPELSVGITTSSPFGFLSLAPDTPPPWPQTLTNSIPADASESAPFYYRDGQVGSSSLTASAGTQWDDGVTTVTIEARSFEDDFESGTLLTTDTPPGRWHYF